MTQKDKEILLKDLCARLPYGVKVKVKYYDDNWRLLAIYTNGTTYAIRDIGYPIETCFEDCKPYLFPLSSMTEEQSKEYHELIGGMFGTSAIINFEILEDFFHKNHFDYRGLIEKGLAIDATNLNIYWLWL